MGIRADHGNGSGAIVEERPRASAGLIPAALITGMLAAVIAAVAGALNRGFDLSDEGHYLLSYMSADAANSGSSQFATLVDVLNGPLEPGLVAYRLVALILLVGTASFLALAALRYLDARVAWIVRFLPPRWLVVAFVVLCGLLGYAWLPLSLSYNTITAALMQLTAGTLLLAAAERGPQETTRRRILLATAGLLVGLLIFMKWPSAVLLTGLGAGFLLLGAERRRHALVDVGMFVASGVAAAVVLSVDVWGGPFSFAGLLDAAGGAVGDGSYRPSTLLTGYLYELRAAGLTAMTTDWFRILLLVAAATPILIAPGQRRVGRSRLLALGVPLAATAFLIVDAAGGAYARSDTRMPIAMTIALILSLLLIPVQRRVRKLPPSTVLPNGARTFVAAVLLLSGLPFAAAIGTRTSLLPMTMNGAAAFGVVAVMLVACGRASIPSQWRAGFRPHAMALPAIAVVLGVQILHGVVLDPYRLPAPATEQTAELVAVPRLAGVRVDAESHRVLTEVWNIVGQTDFRQGDTVIAFSRLPGLVYAIGGTPPSPRLSFIDVSEDRVAGMCERLLMDADAVRKAKLLIVNETNPTIEQCLERVLPGFAGGSELIGTVELTSAYGSGHQQPGGSIRIYDLRPNEIAFADGPRTLLAPACPVG